MPQDPRLRLASSKLANCYRRKDSPQQVDLVRRDLAAVQIEVAIDRALAASPLPLTDEQMIHLGRLLGIKTFSPNLVDPRSGKTKGQLAAEMLEAMA